MLLSENISPIKHRRQELRKWIIDNETTLKALADAVGIKSPTLDAHLNKDTIPVEHHRILHEELGVPANLLPEPKNLPTGRRPKAPLLAHQSA